MDGHTIPSVFVFLDYQDYAFFMDSPGMKIYAGHAPLNQFIAPSDIWMPSDLELSMMASRMS
jgi:hypothetical protein